MKLLVNIRGANGAGKSTIPLSMMDDPFMKMSWTGECRMPCVTVFPTYGWVALGTYLNKTGGMDTFKNNQETFDALEFAWRTYPEFDILMEGVIASTIKSTYAELFHLYCAKMALRQISPRRIVVLSFVPPLEVCLERVQIRNGGKQVNEEAIASKWRTVRNNVEYFRDQGFISRAIDNSKCPKKNMLKNFFKFCDKIREEKT